MKKLLQQINNLSWLPICFALLALFVYYVPFIIFGDDSYIRVLDCLDNDVAHFKMIIDQHAIFDYDKTLPLLYGIPRSEYIVRFLPIWIFYSILPPFWAFVANDFIVRLIALLGMYFLLQQVVLPIEKAQRSSWIAAFVSVLYSYIPFYTIYGLSAAGLPLLILAFYNLRQEKQMIISYLLILLFGLYSHIELIAPFAGIILSFYYVFLCVRRKKWNLLFLIGLIVYVISFIISGWDLIINFLFVDGSFFHRVEFLRITSNKDVFESMYSLITESQMHCGIFSTRLIILSSIFSLIFMLWEHQTYKSYYITIIALIIIISLCFFAKLLTANCNNVVIQSFQLDRFYFILPSLWFVLFACSLYIISGYTNIIISLFIAALMFPSLCHYNCNLELHSGYRQLIGKKSIIPSYHQYYDVDLFDTIAKKLKIVQRNQTKIVSIGMHPAVAEYNGFFSLDGYVDMYRLEYKHKFRSVIKNELKKNDDIQKNFDNWGNRCYLFTAELGRSYLFAKNSGVHLKYLNINTNVLVLLGCQYVFSAVPIDNFSELNLSLKGEYETSNSFRKIWVYTLNSNE